MLTHASRRCAGGALALTLGMMISVSVCAGDPPVVGDDIVVADELLVLLSAEHSSAGEEAWVNGGSGGGDFQRIGDPLVEDILDVAAITFNNEGLNDDAYQSAGDAPAGLVGPNATRTIEVWAYNPEIDGEETLLSWGRRGGPDGTNMAFNYGNHGNFGAVGHWGGGGPDIGWIDNSFTAGAPEAGVWHHLVYTYDGETTRVYSDGVLWNEEFLGAGRLNTHAGAPITIAQQLTGGGTIEFGGLSGRLSIAKVRIHDGVLSGEDIFSNYVAECEAFQGDCVTQLEPPTVLNEPEEGLDGFCEAQTFYTYRLRAEGVPPPSFAVVTPAGATIDEGGNLSYEIPQPAPDQFEVEIEVSNEVGSATASWTVEKESITDTLAEADDLLVYLDVSDLRDEAGGAGPGPEFWLNRGEAGDFIRAGSPEIVERGGSDAVSFNEDGRSGDSYLSPDPNDDALPGPAPEGVVGPDPTRSIEVWAYNGTVPSEEAMIAWGHRGGPDGSNMAFNYGSHPNFGAVTHWGGNGPDMGWDDAGGAPGANQWHHLVYTYDGVTTRVYSDGELWNSEELSFGVINTHIDTPIALAQTWRDALSFEPALEGSLSIARARVHDGVLSPCQILSNFLLEVPDFSNAPAFLNAPENASYCIFDEVYRFRLQVSGTPPPELVIISPDGATITSQGQIEYFLPDPRPESFTVEVSASSTAGDTTVSWTVTRQELAGELQIAEDTFVDLDVRDLLDENPDVAADLWLNDGTETIGDFIKIADPQLVQRGTSGAWGVSFNEDGRSGDSYQSPEDPLVDPLPEGILGPDPTRSIEVWAFNPPPLPGEETILSWGKRGGPDGSNMAFNYGNHGNFGAVGHWGGGGPDLGWIDNTFTAGAPEPDQWHHLVYTYDGETTRVYSDGELWNEEALGAGVINTHTDARISLAQQHEGDGAAFTTGLQGTLTLARVRIHDGVLSACQISSNYTIERSNFDPPPCPTDPDDPEFGDTHCTGIEVTDTGAVFGPTHVITASGEDDSGDPVFYTMTADNGVLAPVVRGPQLTGEWRLRLNGEGWVISVTVDDRFDCDDAADDATCTFSGDPVEICDNEVDDDGDGLTDCADDDCPPCPVTGFVRGDPNSNGTIDLTDGILILNFLFLGGAAPVCMDSGDADDDGSVALTDAVRVFSFLFLGGDAPAPPSPGGTVVLAEECGPDPTDGDALGCADRGATCQ